MDSDDWLDRDALLRVMDQLRQMVKEGNMVDMFLANYGDNAYQLERMGRLLDASRNRLLKGNSHLLIVSHVDAYTGEEESVINEASLRANRIRAYLKVRFDIPHECVAFYIDRSGSYRDRVHVYEVYKPLPLFANTSIHYSESRYPVAIKAAIDRYGAVPYVDLYRRGEKGGYDREVYRIDDPLFDRTELEDYRLAFRGRAPGNGVATVLPEKGSCVDGVLWRITEACEKNLDFYEGFPNFYGKETIQVKDQAGALREVFVYTMNSPHKDVPARPSKFYLDGILEGCLENGLPTKAVMDAVKRTRQEMKKAEKQYTR